MANVSLSDNGLNGFGVELYSNSSFSLSTTATDVYDGASQLIGSGTYVLTVRLSGGSFYTENWSGLMQYYAGSTNSNDASGIYMQGMGHAPNGGVIYARTQRRGVHTLNHKIQVWSNTNQTVSLAVFALKLGSQSW